MKYQYLLRLLLIALLLVFGVVLQLQKGFYASWYLFAAAAVLLVGHAAFGNVFPAFQQLQAGNSAGAETLLRQTWNPRWLVPRWRTYYFLARGMIALQQQRLDEAEPLLQQALKTKPKKALDRAYLYLNLAHIHYVKKDLAGARQLLVQAKAENVNDLMLREHIQRLEKALS